jgi:hypothetical protein
MAFRRVGVLVTSDAALRLLGDVRGLMNPAQLSQ